MHKICRLVLSNMLPKRQQCRSNVRLVAFDNVARTLLLVWTGLYAAEYTFCRAAIIRTHGSFCSPISGIRRPRLVEFKQCLHTKNREYSVRRIYHVRHATCRYRRPASELTLTLTSCRNPNLPNLINNSVVDSLRIPKICENLPVTICVTLPTN